MSSIRKVRIAKAWQEAEGIRVLELWPQDGSLLERVSAGSHIDVHLPNGLIRQYSLCSVGDDSNIYHIAVKLEEKSRGGSVAIHNDLNVDDLLDVSIPKNNFPLSEMASGHLLLAGGIGITPILGMAQEALRRTEPFEVYYFVRSAQTTAFAAVLNEQPLVDHVTIHTGLDVEATSLALKKAIGQAAPQTHLYVCGPAPFMDAAYKVAQDLGWPDNFLHREYFSAVAIPSAVLGAFEIEARKTGVTTVVGVDETIVAALARVGVDIDVSCEQGVCGTCVTTVLDGTPEHLDMYFTDAEKASNSKMCLCVSRSLSPRLVLDV